MMKGINLGAGVAIAVGVGAALAVAAFAQEHEAWRKMNQPVEPFQILGNLYYVGASSVAAYLITTPDGHIVIDGGFPETAPMIRSGIEQLGFEIGDVRILLNSHAHFDHAGGLARLQEWSGAEIHASERDTPLLERGGLEDDLFGDAIPFPAVKVDRRLRHGDTVELGGTVLTANVTAGHTRGCTSWSFAVEESGESFTAVSICSLSVLDGMRFLKDETHPGIAEDFRRSYEILEAIDADLFLASHAEFFRMEEKRLLQQQGEALAFLDPHGYRAYIDEARKDFEQALADERRSLAVDPNRSEP